MNVTVTADRQISMPPDELIGSFRTFGSVGPTYEVVGVVEPATGSEVLLRIRVVESGEAVTYPLSDAVTDPLAP